MSCDEVLPEDLIPIEDVNEERVQEAGRFAVEEYNKLPTSLHLQSCRDRSVKP